MRKIVIIGSAAIALAVAAIAAPTGAEARFGGAVIAQAAAEVPTAQPVQYYGGYSYYRPRYYGGGYYSDYYRYGYPGSRNSLDTCSYC